MEKFKSAKLFLTAFLCACCFTACAGSCGIEIPGDPIVIVKYVVTFDSQGGSGMPELTGVERDAKIAKPAPDPTREGYTFGGWFKNSACTNAWDFDADTVSRSLTLYAKWVKDGDETPEKPVEPARPKHFLILEGAEGEAANLGALIRDETDYSADIKPSAQAPVTAAAMAEYDEVILMNAAAAGLPEAFAPLLDEFVKNGGALFTTGGGNAYRAEDLTGSALEKILPVEAAATDPPLALVLVLHVSTSMMGNDAAGAAGKPSRAGMTGMEPGEQDTRLFAVKTAAKAAVAGLGDSDLVALIRFNSAANLVLDFTPASRIGEINAAIDGMVTAQGSVYNNALVMASNLMAGVDFTDRKHIIFFTNGLPLDGMLGGTYTFYSTIGAMADQGVTLSAMGFNAASNTSAREIITKMALWGGGTDYFMAPYYPAPSNLADLMEEEIERRGGATAVQWCNPGAFMPAFYGGSALFNGLSAPPPNPGGYYYTQAKRGDGANAAAEVHVETQKGAPLYAEWNYGKGRAASLMIPLDGGAWSADYFTQASGKAFIKNILSANGAVTVTPGFKFTPIDGETAFSVSRGAGSLSGNAVIPETFLGLPVTAVAASACGNNAALTGVTVPSGVTRIAPGAFQGCAGLTSLTLPFVGAALNGTDNTHFGYIFGASGYSGQDTLVPPSLQTVIITGGNIIDNQAFRNCGGLTSVAIQGITLY